MSAEARRRLAALEAELAWALAGGGPAPEGFDAERMRLASGALVSKRARAAARAWPGLAAALGERFETEFSAFARATPLPGESGPLADGRAFVRMLRERGRLPEAGLLESLAVDLRSARVRGGGLRPRRGPWLVAAVLRRPARLVVGGRIPRLGERWLVVPLSRRPRFLISSTIRI